MKLRHSAVAAAALPTSRRQFTGLLGGSGLLALTGCGGGGSADEPAPVVAPPPAVTPPVVTPPAVVTAPVITAQPQSQSVAPGAAVSLRVEATGEALAYQWKRTGVAVGGASGAALAFTAQISDHGAQYSAVVSNSAGSVETQAALLGVVRASPPGISLLAGGLGGAGIFQARGAQARLTEPELVAAGADGIVFVLGWQMGAAKISPDGNVKFLARLDAGFPAGMAVDSRGSLFVCSASWIFQLLETATPPQFVPIFGGEPPGSPVFDRNDNLYFVEWATRSIRKRTPGPAGVVTTVAGGFADPKTLLLLPDGNFLVVDGSRLRKMTPDGVVSTLPQSAPAMSSIAVLDGNTLCGLVGHSVVRFTIDTGTVTTIAGQPDARGYVEGAGAAARFARPLGLAVANGELLVADTENHIVRRVVPASGQTSGWVGSAAQSGHVDGPGAQARFDDLGPTVADGAGNVYVLDRNARKLRKITPAGVVSTLFEDFPSLGGLAVDATGNFYGVRNRTIVKVGPTGAQSVFAGQEGEPGFADGTGAAARFSAPEGLALDPQGNLLVGDGVSIFQPSFDPVATFRYGNSIRKITPAGEVTTIAGVPGRVFQVSAQMPPTANPLTEFHRPTAIGCDAAGRVYVLDTTLGNIRRLGAPGTDPVIVSSLGSSAYAFAVTPSGDVYVARGGRSELVPGTVFLRHFYFLTISKLTPQDGAVPVVGQGLQYGMGVTLGPLPGTLNTIGALAAFGNDTLFCCTENSVLEVRLN